MGEKVPAWLAQAMTPRGRPFRFRPQFDWPGQWEGEASVERRAAPSREETRLWIDRDLNTPMAPPEDPMVNWWRRTQTRTAPTPERPWTEEEMWNRGRSDAMLTPGIPGQFWGDVFRGPVPFLAPLETKRQPPRPPLELLPKHVAPDWMRPPGGEGGEQEPPPPEETRKPEPYWEYSLSDALGDLPAFGEWLDAKRRGLPAGDVPFTEFLDLWYSRQEL